jgi:hypothetical protein
VLDVMREELRRPWRQGVYERHPCTLRGEEDGIPAPAGERERVECLKVLVSEPADERSRGEGLG